MKYFFSKFPIVSLIVITGLLAAVGSCVDEMDQILFTEVLIEAPENSLNIGNSLQLNGIAFPQNGFNPSMEWSSSDETIATINDVGLVMGIAPGTVTITAALQKNPNINNTVALEVVAPVTGIAITPPSSNKLGTGYTLQLTATITPGNATDPAVVWSSSDETIATVDQTTGIVTGVAPGTVTITATAEENPEIKDTVEIEVVIPVTEVIIEEIPVCAPLIIGPPSCLPLITFFTFQLSVTVNPPDATNPTVLWSSSDETLATVDDTGKLKTYMTTGTVIITAISEENNTIQDSIEIPITELLGE